MACIPPAGYHHHFAQHPQQCVRSGRPLLHHWDRPSGLAGIEYVNPIADPPTKRHGYDDYYLIAVFDIRIAINAGGRNGRGWRMLAAADLYPYTFEDVVRHLGRIFAVTSQGTCFIWLPSYGTGDYKRNAQTIICIPNGTPLFCRDQPSPDQNKIADPGCAFASAIRSNLEPCR